MGQFKDWIENLNPNSTDLFTQFKAAMDRQFGGDASIETIMTDEYIRKLGFDVTTLLKNSVIQNYSGGNYVLNKDLASTNGKLGPIPPPPPALPMNVRMARWIQRNRIK